MARIPRPKQLADLYEDKDKRRSASEPESSKDKPKCPDYFNKDEKQKWAETAKTLDEMGMLSKTDTDALIAYCQAWVGDGTAEIQFEILRKWLPVGWDRQSAWSHWKHNQFW